MARALDPRRLALLEERYGRVIERHDARGAAVDPTRYASDPVGFARDVLRDEPWSRQAEMMLAVRDNQLVAVRGANSVGKDHAAAALMLWWAYACRGLVVSTGPTQRQVDEIVFGREIKTLWRRSGLPGMLLARALRTEPDDDGDGDEDPRVGILGFVSTDMAKLTGHHAPRVMCAITEAQGVADMVFDAMFSNATGPDDRILAVANPAEPVGQFYAASRPNSGWLPLRIPATEHPNVVEGRMVIPGGPSREQFDRLRRTNRGPGTRYWKVFVDAEFPESATDAIVARSVVLEAFARWGGGRMAEANGHEPVVGLDPARTGGDLAVAAPVRGPVVYPLEEHEPDQRNPTRSVAEFAEGVMLRHGGFPDPRTCPKELAFGQKQARGRFIVDVALMGGGAIDLLRERGWEVMEFNGSEKAREAPEPGRFENRRAFGYYGALKDALETGAPVVAPNDALLEELMATRVETSHREGAKIVTKKEIRAAIGRSPDHADAVMMAWLEANGQGGGGAGGDATNPGM